MPKITYVAHDGTTTHVDAIDGDSVMHAAVANGVVGIAGECGGSMACATCHCYIDESWAGLVGGPDDSERAMLDCAASEVKVTSRLSCQIKVSRVTDGLVVRMPESQR
ncbi:2Fe-2S iron-sulfur cluster-binding protein [Bradyrhizobium sp. WSM2254]|uniref:2Fe-2S iron-sulfur cluster-binding protein n=1 Tax=Bradyrhizobium sp. WSM2254 TaxID=1188263 RepID=UPI0009FFF4AC|nr:2Fe-2S iron-sulfur cluster-binding protein [Bradyrhizobium sp. WSM2254]